MLRMLSSMNPRKTSRNSSRWYQLEWLMSQERPQELNMPARPVASTAPG